MNDSSLSMKNLKTIQEFQGRRTIFKNSKMFFKNKGHNEFW